MKVIKKSLKVALCFSAIAATGIACAVSPSISAYASVNHGGVVVADEINALKVPTTVDATQGQPFVIPTLNGVSDYSIKVYDTADQVHTWNVGSTATNTDADKDYFDEVTGGIQVNYLNNGEYKVVYVVDGVYSHIYRVQVKNLSYELSFVESNGLKQLVKPTVDVSNETDTTKWIKLPTATVSKIVDGESIEIAEQAEVSVYIDGAKAVKNVSEPEKGTWQTAASLDDAKSKVSAYSTANSSTKKKLHVVEITTGDDAGIYVIPSEEVQFTAKYSYNKGDNRPSTQYVIDVVKDFEEPEEFTVKTPEIPAFELGDKDIELNLPTVSNKYQDNVAYNVTKVVIRHKDKKETVKQELTNNDLTFDMTTEAFGVSSYESLTGTYEIIYTIEDAYGNSDDVTYKKENITISSNPSAYMSYDYTVTTDAGIKTASGVDKNYAVDLKAEYTFNDIVVPAAYGEDKITKYNDLIIVRTLIDTEDQNNAYYIDNVKYSNGKLVPISSTDNRNYAVDLVASEDVDDVDVSKAVAFKFSDTEAEKMAGKTFILRYEVRSKNIKTRVGKLISPETGSEYTFKVVDTIEKGKAPTIKITELSEETVKTGDSVSVEVSATDGKDSRLATRVYTIDGAITDSDEIQDLKDLIQDSVTEVLTKPATSDYSYGKCNVLDYQKFLDGVTTSHSTFKAIDLVEGKNDVYSFVADTAKTVVAVTVNDDGTVAVETEVVTIKVLNDTVEPNYEIIDAKSFGIPSDSLNIYELTATVGETITLPNIRFNDGVNGDGSLALSVAYYKGSPITEDGINFKYPKNTVLFNNVAIGGKITLTEGGTYTVVYTATDDAGNTKAVSFSFVAKEIIKTQIDVDLKGSKDDGFKLNADGAEANSGAIIKINPSVVNYDKETYTSGAPEINWELECGNLYYEYLGDNKYQFFGEGEYKFRFNAGSDDTASGMQEYTIKINSIKLAWSEETFGTVPVTAQLTEKVFLPMPTTNSSAKISVKVTKGGKDVAVEYVNDGWTFVAAEEGAYKVQYIAEDANYVLEDSSSKFTINVGDNVKPKLTVSQQTTLEQDIIYDGTNNIEYKVSIDSSNKKVYIDVISNGEKIIDHLDIGLSVTDKNDAGDLDNNTAALWRTVDAEFAESSTIEKGEDYQWFISGTGEYTLTISASDKNNVGEVKIVFNVVRQTEAENESDTAVGIALIVVSLVILAGVIGYFAFAGKKGGSLKSRKNKVSEVEVDDESVEVEETKTEEVETEQVVEENSDVETVEETVETEPTQEAVEEVKVEETTEEAKAEETDSTDAE